LISHTPPPGFCGFWQFVPPDETLLVGGQSPATQQFVSLMQSFCDVHALSPEGQLHEPPGPLHVSPVTVQSLFKQQDVIGMHELLRVQYF
jgi:hypothetical protein